MANLNIPAIVHYLGSQENFLNLADDPTNPAVSDYNWDLMYKRWVRIRDLIAGTEAMRRAGETYLPRHPKESEANWERRLQTAVLENVFEITANSLVGKPFSDPVVFSDSVPEQIHELQHDIDLLGNCASVFARNWFYEGLTKGFAHAYVDMPPAQRGARQTLADDREQGRRPFWVMLQPENVIGVISERHPITGREVFTQVRVFEYETSANGFQRVTTPQIRVHYVGYNEVYKRDSRANGKWLLEETNQTGLDFIPFITFYTNRQDTLLSKPPLEDLAFLNIKHWQSSADQANVLTVARFPIITATGWKPHSNHQELVIGPKAMLISTEVGADFKYLEHSGEAIASGRQELQDLLDVMTSYGGQFLRKKISNTTAKARILDSAESTSPLQDMVTRFGDSFNTLLQYTATMLGIEDGGGTIHMNTNFGPTGIDAVELNALTLLVEKGVISKEAFVNQLQNRGVLDASYSFNRDKAVLATEEPLEPDPVSPAPATRMTEPREPADG